MNAELSVSTHPIFPGTRVPCPSAGNHLLLSAAALRERSAACVTCDVRGPCRTLYAPEATAPDSCWIAMAVTRDQSRCADCSVREPCHDLVAKLAAIARRATH